MQNESKIAIVASRFNEAVTEKLYTGAIQRLTELNFTSAQIKSVWVPGAIEIPLTALRLARTQQFSAIICLGAVILGETKHFDYVCQQVSAGCQHVALTENIPVVFGILTTNTEEQAFDRVGGSRGHVGRSSVDTAIEMITTLREI